VLVDDTQGGGAEFDGDGLALTAFVASCLACLSGDGIVARTTPLIFLMPSST
jgi:hypothetical protein